MQVFGNFSKASGSDENGQLLQLLLRVKEATSIPERISALNDLNEILSNTPITKEQLLTSTEGLSILSKALSEREDPSIAQGALEVLLLVTGCNEVEGSINRGGLNCGVFCQSLERLVVLLSLFEPEPIGINDFYVHYNAIQLLQGCLKTAKSKLQEVVAQNGTGGLLLMLSERDAIRNEVILILTKLAEDSLAIQQSLVQGGVLRLLFDIVKSEGGSEGGIVVQDCLELISVLLRKNETTQRQFRESGYFQTVLSYLELVNVKRNGVEALLTANQSISQHKLQNLKTLISAVVHLLDEGLSIDGLAYNAQAFNSCDCLPVLSQLCLNEGGVGDWEVRKDALYSMSQVLKHSKEAKKLFMKLRVFWNGQPTEAIQAILKTLFNANDHLEVMSTRNVLIGFFHEYPEGQLWILGNTQEPTSIFLDVFYTMETVKDGLELGKRSTQIMASIVKGNVQIQELFTSFEMPIPNRPPTRIFKWIMELLRYCVDYGTDHEHCRYLVEVLIRCLERNPKSVEILIQEESNVNFLITKSQSILNPLLNGERLENSSYIPLILATCLEAVIQEHKHPNFRALRDYLVNVIQTSIGIKNFLLMIEVLHQLVDFEVIGPCLNLLKTQFQSSKEPPSTPQEDQSKLQEELRKTQDQLGQFQQFNGELSNQLKQSQNLIQQQATEIEALKKQIEEGHIKEEMFACLGLQQMKLKALSQKLISLGFDPVQIINSTDFNSF